MSELKAYPEYKDSGVEWIGEIPKDWDITKLKHVSNVVMGQSPDSESINNQSKGLPFLQGNAEFTNLYPTAKHHCSNPKKTSSVGDILFSVRAPVGEMNWSNSIYVIGRGLCSLRAKDGFVQLYLWFLLNCLKVELFSKMTGSTFEAVTTTDVRESNVILPTKQEQKQIGNYLSMKTSQIDTLISDKEHLIELLEEKRQAVITETVTKGLDPNVKMKDSGIEWIGEVPEHWEEKRIKYLFREINERNFDENVVLLSLFTNIGVKPRSEMEEKGNRAQTVLNYKKVKKGDIVVNKLLAWMGAIGISDYDGVTSPDYDVYEPIDNQLVHNEYFHYYFRCHYFKGDCYKFGRGIMMMRWRTYPEQFKSIIVPAPPIEEQKKIASYLDQFYTVTSATINSLEKQITKLKEYRESLIYEAVTGKIDVRNYTTEKEASY